MLSVVNNLSLFDFVGSLEIFGCEASEINKSEPQNGE